MRFLVDAHLPPGLCIVLGEDGHEAAHTRDLIAQNRTKDSVINEISIREERVVISKDTDFYHSHLLHGMETGFGAHWKYPDRRFDGFISAAFASVGCFA
ncbi:MAG TPA: DUF5615 family PIN-like protein [Verrucomicrobiae bacterium]|nr:DUF5615 family PIN-like protein [Verrucomicrobiae bacterium]